MANVLVVGLGYVGITTLVGLADLGHKVLGLDLNLERITELKKGNVPFFEEGIQELLHSKLNSGEVSFSNSYDDIDDQIQFAFICVSTPSSANGHANLTYVNDAVGSLSSQLSEGSIIVVKSTVPIGTCEALSQILLPKNIKIASNPEFLAEGRALFDFMQPNRIVVGAGDPITAKEVVSLYDGIDAPRLICSLTSAESIKYASNAFLAVKLSFVNELAALCEITGASISDVVSGMSFDNRIGDKFLNPGPGWGGSCFPKDASELASSARRVGTSMLTVEAAIVSNKNTVTRIADIVVDQLGGRVAGSKIAIWGLSFKANTDDIRDSPAIAVGSILANSGAQVVAYDPMVRETNENGILIGDSPIEACRNADALVVLTEWPEFSKIEPNRVVEVMKANASVLDTRRVLNVDAWEKLFTKFRVIGR